MFCPSIKKYFHDSGFNTFAKISHCYLENIDEGSLMKYQYMYRTYLRYKKLCIQYEYGTVSTVPAEVDFTNCSSSVC